MAGYIEFPKDELEIIQAIWPAEEFRKTALAQYGGEWWQYVPQDINAFTMRYFKIALFPYHLAVYYCPTKEATIHGGRGSGKTDGLGVAFATYAALHPGENHLHVAPTKDQAKKTYDAVVNLGTADGLKPRFYERFIDDAVVAPFPEIRLKRWNDKDTGTILRFRSIDENIERLRSHEAGSISGDEAFRTIPDGHTYSALRGCIRGPNRFRFNLLSPEKQEELTVRMNSLTMVVDQEERQIIADELEQEFEDLGIQKRGLMCLYGNAGDNEWEWQRHDMGYEHPERYFSFTATTYDNPYYGKANVQALEDQYADDPDAKEVEMEAGRPRNLGDIFMSHTVEKCTDHTLLPEIVRHIKAREPGYKLARRNDTGIYLYSVPPTSGSYHVIAADPGSGLAPGRNKWTICAFDVSQRPCPMVYFEMGYMKRSQTGDFLGFIGRLQYVHRMYPSAPGDMWIESTGNQKGMTQIAWPEELKVKAVEFTTMKAELINKLKQLMGAGSLRWPAIPRLLQELGNYVLPDNDIVQDIATMLFCAAGGIWRYYPVKPAYKMPRVTRVVTEFLGVRTERVYREER